MLRSMTGFGAASSTVADHALELSIRAVNHRHLQVKARLGSELAALEGVVEKTVRATLARGAVTVHVNVTRVAGVAPVQLDRALVRAYRDELSSAARELGLEAPARLEDLLGLPGVLAPVEGEREEEQILAAPLLALLKEALAALVAMREEEGAALERDLRQNLDALRAIAANVEARMPEVVRGHREALSRRVNELLGDASAIAPADLAREVAILADRLDVSEEVARLASHYDQLEKLLDGGGAIGRQLDFLCQELFREVNTIGSKCNDAQVAHWVVEAKTRAERLREQVQNVE